MLDRRLRVDRSARWLIRGLAKRTDRKPPAKGVRSAFSTCPVGLSPLGDGKNGSPGARIDMRMIYASDEKVFLVNKFVRSHFPN
jgi:hypothetical protein